MTSFIKGKLKAARDHIAKKDFQGARVAAEDILSYDAENYNANVFLGLSLLELGHLDQSEQAYLRATKAQPDQVLAWQGLCRFYERAERWDQYASTLRTIMIMYAKGDDAPKCAEQLQKYIDNARRRNKTGEIIEALSLLLPSSELYSVLSTLPPPDPTSPTSTVTFAIQAAVHNSLPVLEEIVALIEKGEETLFNQEFERRRTRLDAANAGPAGIRKQVGKAIWRASKLPELYNEIINHVNTTDDLRREVEAKLLRYKMRLRNCLDMSGDERSRKLGLTKQIQDAVAGVVLLGVRDELAWQLYFDGKDVDEIELYGLDEMRRHYALFPDAPLSKCIRGYLISAGHSMEESQESNKDEPHTLQDDVDAFDLILEGFATLPESILAHIIAVHAYWTEKEFQDLITVSENGIQLVRRHEVDTGVKLSQVEKSFNISLATGLVHLFPPKHHRRAIPIVEDILSSDPNNVHALMARGFIMQAAGKFADASEVFLAVPKWETDDNKNIYSAREEYGWCLAEMGELESAAHELRGVLDKLELSDGQEIKKARVCWRLGVCLWRLGGENIASAYRQFIASLKHSANFAPAFTSLGIYYLEGVSPPDTNRATKCFQKAFELDAREVDAAQRLAHAFAEDREWDLVQVIAQRVIEGEGGLGGGLSDSQTALARFKPTNAWAWKALGVVELNNRNYPAAINALQVALRSDDAAGVLWIRLGEAYMKAGRHAAALKALNKALELEPDEWMATYLLAEVQRQMGRFIEAIASFESVLDRATITTTVLLSLAETHLAQGRVELTTGYLARAASSFLSAAAVSVDLVRSSPGFRRLALKTTIDALIALSEFSDVSYSPRDAQTLATLVEMLGTGGNKRLDDIVALPLSIPEGGLLKGEFALKLGAALSSFRITLFTSNESGLGTAWYDLSLALERIASTALSEVSGGKARKQATDAARQALLLQPQNAAFWNLFGNLNFTSRPAIAQHAYVRALECNSKDAAIWTNLGLFYLHHEDLDLANQALLKAQTLDPDYTLAWVGQGLVASTNGHAEDSTVLFEHAISLAADIPAADIQYAYRAFYKLPASASRDPKTIRDYLFQPFFALDRYCRRNTNDASALHLFGLVCERLNLTDLSLDVVSRAIQHLEAAYEETEDPVIERRYAIANATLARLRLASDDFEGAVESFETAFGLLQPDGKDEDDVRLRALCQFGCAIAFFHMGNLEGAVEKFESAQDIAKDHPNIRGQITVLLSKALWAIGSDEFRDSAKEQLLDCINHDPENLTAVIALAAMGLLTNDETLIDAALSEILALPIEERHLRDPERNVEDLLVNHHLAEGQYTKASSVLQGALHAEPENANTRASLASFSISQGQPQVAQALLSNLLDSPTSGDDESLRLLAISIVAGQTREGAKREEKTREAKCVAQKAVKVAPWEGKNWLALALANKPC